MMKKFKSVLLSTVLSLSLALSCTYIPVSAEETANSAHVHNYVDGVCECGDVLYKDLGGIRYTVTGKLRDGYAVEASVVPGTQLTGEVTLFSYLVMNSTAYYVKSLAENAFANQTGITSIVLTNNIDTIGKHAFYNCSSLKVITLSSESFSNDTLYSADEVFAGLNSDCYLYTPYDSLPYKVLAANGNISYKVYNAFKNDVHVHQYTYHIGSEPTCTKNGAIEYISCRSGESKFYSDIEATKPIDKADITIPALGHDWDTEYTIDTPATDDTPGSKSIHCKRCGAIDRKTIMVIPALKDNNNDSNNDNNDNSGSNDNNNNNNNDNTNNDNNNNNNDGSNDTTDDSNNTKDDDSLPKKGDKFTVNTLNYIVTSVNSKKKVYTVSCTGSDKKSAKVNIPATVTDGNYKYNVTGINSKAFYKNTKLKSLVVGSNVKSIGAQAFAKCSNLKSIQLKTSLLTKNSVGKQAFTGINKKASVKVPAKKKASYKKWFKSKGLIIK